MRLCAVLPYSDTDDCPFSSPSNNPVCLFCSTSFVTNGKIASGIGLNIATFVLLCSFGTVQSISLKSHSRPQSVLAQWHGIRRQSGGESGAVVRWVNFFIQARSNSQAPCLLVRARLFLLFSHITDNHIIKNVADCVSSFSAVLKRLFAYL